MTTKTTDLVYAGASLRERQDYALALSKAGDLIPRGFRDPNGQPNAGKILLATEYGNALGVHPIVAINSIDIIEGNLTITPALMSGLVRTAGHKLRVSTAGSGQQLTATATLIRSDDPQHPFEVTWTMQDAKAAGLDGKSNWKKYPRAMLKARAISEVCREGAEDVLMGAYVPEEMGATVNEAGAVIDAEIVEDEPRRDSKLDQPRAKVEKGVASEREVLARAKENHTPPGAQRPGGSRTASKSAAGSADEPSVFERADVATMWIGRIRETDTMPALIALREDVVKRGSTILDYQDADSHTIDQWFNRRRGELQQAAAGEPEPAIMLEGDQGVYEDDSVPF